MKVWLFLCRKHRFPENALLLIAHHAHITLGSINDDKLKVNRETKIERQHDQADLWFCFKYVFVIKHIPSSAPAQSQYSQPSEIKSKPNDFSWSYLLNKTHSICVSLLFSCCYRYDIGRSKHLQQPTNYIISFSQLYSPILLTCQPGFYESFTSVIKF